MEGSPESGLQPARRPENTLSRALPDGSLDWFSCSPQKQPEAGSPALAICLEHLVIRCKPHTGALKLKRTVTLPPTLAFVTAPGCPLCVRENSLGLGIQLLMPKRHRSRAEILVSRCSQLGSVGLCQGKDLGFQVWERNMSSLAAEGCGSRISGSRCVWKEAVCVVSYTLTLKVGMLPVPLWPRVTKGKFEGQDIQRGRDGCLWICS